MNDKVFLDTNVLIYCYTSTEPEKQVKAKVVASLADVVISTQVLKEFINTLSKKFRLDWSTVSTALAELESNFQTHTNTPVTIRKACEIAERYQFSFYDSLIVAAALEAGCDILYSEDLQDGQVIDGKITIVNPIDQ